MALTFTDQYDNAGDSTTIGINGGVDPLTGAPVAPGQLSTTHVNNLKNLIGDVKSHGFEYTTLGFFWIANGPFQQEIDAGRLERYKSMLAQVVVAALSADSGVIFDLANESFPFPAGIAGSPESSALHDRLRRFVPPVWNHFLGACASTGRTSKTCLRQSVGFSLILSDRTDAWKITGAHLDAMYGSQSWPGSMEIHLYDTGQDIGNPRYVLDRFGEALIGLGSRGTDLELVIGEAFYNDELIAMDVRAALEQDFPNRISRLLHWQTQRDPTICGGDIHGFPSNFSEYSNQGF